MREIPKINYFYLLILSVVTIVLALAFFNIYHNYAKDNESFISKNLTNINGKNLTNVLRENSIVFVYVDDINNKDDDKLQENVFNSIKEKDAVKYFYFFDNSKESNQKYMTDNYNIDIKNKKIILVFEDNKLVIRKSINDVEKDIDSIISFIEVDND